MKKIAVLTSGGDAPGMNACIRAVVRTALYKNLRVIGIRRGYTGLLSGDFMKMTTGSVANIIQRGGTILGTSRCEEFRTSEGRARAFEMIQKEGIEGLIVIGGDGTFRGAYELSRQGDVPIVGVPGTIDNDVYGTDETIGFDTAINTALEAIDKIRDTAASHERVFFVEVMGRSSGFIAAQVGLGGGAEFVVVPETRTDLNELCERLLKSIRRGKKACIVIVAEGKESGGAFQIAQQVNACIGTEYRVCVLGHIQRGGSPTARDRVLASKLGSAAVNALLAGHRNVMVGEVKGEIVLTPLEETWTKVKPVDRSLLELVDILAGGTKN